MSFVAAAIVGSSVVAGVMGDRAASRQSRAAGRASNAQVAATELQIEEERRQYDQTREDFAPWREMGEGAVGRMNNAMGGDMSDFNVSAGYNFVRNEGMRDTENRFSVGGGGGNAMKALVDFNSGLASTEYGNWFGRNLAMSGQGMGATQSTAIAGDRSTQRIGQAYGNAGNARAGAEYARGDAAATRYGAYNNAAQSGISNYLYGRERGWWGGEGEEEPPIYGG